MHRVDNGRAASDPKNLVVLQIKKRQRRAVTGGSAQGLFAFPNIQHVQDEPCPETHANPQRLSMLQARKGTRHASTGMAAVWLRDFKQLACSVKDPCLLNTTMV